MRYPANPIHDWLDNAGIPWQVSRADLTARYGVSTDNPYHHERVLLEMPSMLDGMLSPLAFNASHFMAAQYPPLSLSSQVSIGNSAKVNIQHCVDQLSAALGQRDIAVVANTLQAEWHCDAALIRLTAWPPTLQSRLGAVRNDAHVRDPRLVTACHITIQTGWRLPISTQERAWLEGAVPLGRIRNWQYPSLRDRHIWVQETLLAYTRFPPPDAAALEGQFGRSADNRAFLIHDGTLYIVPVDRVVAFEVDRILPAKGSGGSALKLRCLTTNPAYPESTLVITEREGADDLNDIAAELAASVGKPVILHPYIYDA